MTGRLSRWLLPEWARTDHPLLQYELLRMRGRGARHGTAFQLVALAGMLGGAAVIARAVFPVAAGGDNLTTLIWQSSYYPMLGLQLLTVVLALAMGAAAAVEPRRRKTWDHLRVTESGAESVLRVRWAGILYRLRAPLTLLFSMRLLFVGGMLYDLTAFGGHYAQMLGAQASPPLPAWRLDLLLIALSATVCVLLPFAQVGLAAALGILISVALRERLVAAIAHLIIIALQVAFTLAGALAFAEMLPRGAPDAGGWPYALVLGASAFGDWGLLLAQLGSLGEVWRRVELGWTLSLALMLVTIALGLAGDGMMRLAARLAESRG